MTEQTKTRPRRNTPSYKREAITAVPFDTVKDAWFWFIQAQQARNDGAQSASLYGISRPCEPIDFLKIMDRLYRNRMLTMDHFKVLRHYGMRQMAPDPSRPKESRAWHLWKEALNRFEPILERKGIIVSSTNPTENWAQEALVYESNQSDMFAGMEA